MYSDKNADLCSRHLVLLVTALLVRGDHFADVDVVGGEHDLGTVDGGCRQCACAPKDPGKVDVEQPKNVSAGVDHGRGHIVSVQDPVRAVGGKVREADPKLGWLSDILHNSCPFD